MWHEDICIAFRCPIYDIIKIHDHSYAAVGAYANHFRSPLLLDSFSRTKFVWLMATCRTTYGHYLRLNSDNGHVHPAAGARRDESLIIIIHKILLWESARRETKQERCAAKQEGVPSLLRGLLMSSSSPSWQGTGVFHDGKGVCSSQSSRNPITSGVCAH